MAWTIIGWIFAVIGWVLLALLALVVLLMLVPVTLSVQFKQGVLSLWVRILFIKLRILPAKPSKERPPKKNRPPKKAKAKAAHQAQDAEKKPKPLSDKIAFFKRVYAAGLVAVKRFLRHLRIKQVELVLPVHAEDAAATALRCGQMQAAIGTVYAILAGRLHIRCKRIQVLPDFTAQYSDALFFACKVCFSPGIIFPVGFAFLRRWLQKRPYSKKVYKQALAEKRLRAAQQHTDNGTVA